MNNMQNKIIELKIDSIANGGDGVGRYEGIACFVPGVVKGETVKAKVTSAKKKYMRAEPVEILKSSKNRATVGCPFALNPDNFTKDYCPGCQYQHISYKEELRAKTQQFKDLLERFAKLKPEEILLETIPSPHVLHYRNKITLHTDKAKTKIGYYIGNNKGIINLKKCPLAHKDINNRLKNFDLNIPIIEDAKEIVFRYTKKDEVLVYTDKSKNDILLEEDTTIGKFKVPLKSFFQININARELLLQKVIELLKDNPTKYAFDLYCGIGLFAIAASKNGVEKVYASDLDRKAIQTAKMNANSHNCKIKFLELPAFSAVRSILSTLNKSNTTLILDPPRTGLDKQTISYIIDQKPKNIIYISCGPDTLCRDLNLFTQNSYTVKQTQIIDMFPRTAHFETITFLSYT